ncbi:hypothetical protein CC79DRAFT_1361987 [Sarocladium strictum]
MDLITDSGAPPLDGKVHRHFPITVRYNNKDRRRTANHIARDTAKQYARKGAQHEICPGLNYCRKPDATPAEKCTLQHIEKDLAYAVYCSLPWTSRDELHDGHIDGRQGRRTRRWCRPRGLPGLVEENSTALAKSDVPFPSDHDHTVRRPSLEREDAFCDANTFKPHGVRTLGSGNDAEVADLYRMGLLYDDDETKDTFNLNTIRREEPAYTIRPAKRARKAGGKSRASNSSRQLNLDLSFADLGDDDAIARYLDASSATTPAEIAAAHEEAIQHVAAQRSSSGSPPLRVIYELDSLQPSFDVETSQPPGLVDDFLSDYDCFSDSDFDETPTQEREIREDGATADTWIMLD